MEGILEAEFLMGLSLSAWDPNTTVSGTQYTSFRGLVSLGLGGIGSARVAGFNSTDADRYIALAQAYDKPESLKVRLSSAFDWMSVIFILLSQ